jgi:hypothetical protein
MDKQQCSECDKQLNTDSQFYDITCECGHRNHWENPAKETSERLYHLIWLGHPIWKGEPYRRGDVIDAIRHRQDVILTDIGWPDKEETMFRNRHTADEETLKSLTLELRHFIDNPDKRAWAVMEHWKPVSLWTDYDEEHLMDEFRNKRKSSLTAFGLKKIIEDKI